jgi:hypothetical protein
MSHPDDWDEARMQQWAARLKRQQVDMTCALVSEPPEEPLGWRWVFLDKVLSSLTFDLLAVHLRVDDDATGSCMGLEVARLSCQPLGRSEDSLGAMRRHMEAVEPRLYVDPKMGKGPDPPLPVVRIGMITVEMDFPDIFRTLARREVTPRGWGRRMRVTGKAFDLHGQVREVQMNHFLYYALHVFYGGERHAWKVQVVDQHLSSCRPWTPEERRCYIDLDRLRHRRDPGIVRELERLEDLTTYPEIIRARCDSRGWVFPPAPPDDPREPELLGVEGDPRAAEWDAMAAFMAVARRAREDRDCSMREFVLEDFVFENLEVEFYRDDALTPFGPGLLETTLYAEWLRGHVRCLISMDSQGLATGAAGRKEPQHAWVDVGGYAAKFMVVTPTGERAGRGDAVASQVSPFLLSGPIRGPVADAPDGAAAPFGGAVAGPQDHEAWNLHGAFRMWRTGRMEIEAGFVDCRLVVYLQRILSIAALCTRTFRPPAKRPWMAEGWSSHLSKPFELGVRPREYIRRPGSLMQMHEVFPVLQDRSSTASSQSSIVVAPSSTRKSGLNAEVSGGPEQTPGGGDLQQRLRVLGGRLMQICLELRQDQIVFVADLDDPDSSGMVMAISATAILTSEADRESLDMDVESVALMPAVPDESSTWMRDADVPRLLPTPLHGSSVGLYIASQPVLEPMPMVLNYSLGPGDDEELSGEELSLAGEKEEEFLNEDDDDAAVVGIPRLLRIFVTEARLLDLTDSVDMSGLVKPGVVVTCGEEQETRQSLDVSTNTPRFDDEFYFLYTSSRPYVRLDIVDFCTSPTKQRGAGRSREDYQLVASTMIDIQDEKENDIGVLRRLRLPLTSDDGAWYGDVEVEVQWTYRLLVVTIHRVQHLVRYNEGRDSRPFVEVAVDGARLRTQEFGNLEDFDVESDFVFRTTEAAPAIQLSLRNHGRVHDTLVGSMHVVFKESSYVTSDGRVGEWFRLKNAEGIVVCEIKASINWTHSLSANGERDPSPTPMVEEEQLAAPAPRGGHRPRMSIDAAVATFRRQQQDTREQSVIVQAIHMRLAPLAVHASDLDFAVLRGALGSLKKRHLPPNAFCKRGWSSRADSGARQASESSASLDRSLPADKKELHRLFKSFDYDGDGRLNVSQLRDFLKEIGHGMALTRSEASSMAARLVAALPFAPDDLVTWPGFRQGLESAWPEFEHADTLRDGLCEEFVSMAQVKEVLGPRGLEELASIVARADPGDDFMPLWQVLDHETGLTRKDLGQQSALVLQQKLVRRFQNFKFARDLWELIIVPSLYDVPEIRSINREGYLLMGSPVSVGDPIFGDTSCQIVGLPPALEGQMLTGVRTLNRDRSSVGHRFLSFVVSQDAVIYVCYDSRLKKVPKWLYQLGFAQTRMSVKTTESSHLVFSRVYASPCVVVLGGNEGRRRDCSNYFVLCGRKSAFADFALAGDVDGMMRPGRWLLQGRSEVGPEETLHGRLFSIFGIGRRDARDATPASGPVAKLLHPQVLVLRAKLDCPEVGLEVLDATRLPRLTLSVVTPRVDVELRHSMTQDWLGRNDMLTGNVSLQLSSKYFNPTVGAYEFFVEPWTVECNMANTANSPLTEVNLSAPRHFTVNVSTHVMDSVRGLMRVPRLDSERYRRFLAAQNKDVAPLTQVLLINQLGVPLILNRGSDRCHLSRLNADSHSGGAYLELQDGESGTCWVKLESEDERTLPPLHLQARGWGPVNGVRVGLTGQQGFPLRMEAGEDDDSSTGEGPGQDWVLRRRKRNGRRSPLDAPVMDGLLLVVESREPSITEMARQPSFAGTESPVALVVEFRSNVRFMNMTRVSVKATIGALRTGETRSRILKEHETMVLPLSIIGNKPTLAVDRLEEHVEEDGKEQSNCPSPDRAQAQVEPVRLHPALFDPTVHEALRRTRALEERSLSLNYKAIPGQSALEVGRAGAGGEQHDQAHQQARGDDESAKAVSALKVDWTIAALPPYELVNLLPCPLEVQVLQPARNRPFAANGSPASAVSGRRRRRPSTRRDPAHALFSLPDGLLAEPMSRRTSVSLRIAQMPTEDTADDSESLQLEPVSVERAGGGLGSGGWPTASVVIWHDVVETGSQRNIEHVHLDRSMYIRVRLLPGHGTWSRLHRIPSTAHMSRLEERSSIFTGSLEDGDDYAEVQVLRRWRPRGTRRVTFYSDYWVINKTGLALAYHALAEVEGKKPPAAGLPPGRLFSDRQHLERFGKGTRIPLMLLCPGKTLKVMPYALRTQATEDSLYVSEASLGGSRLCFVNSCFRPGSRVFADTNLTVTGMPPFLRGTGSYGDLLAIVTCRFREVSKLLAATPSPAVENDPLTFRVSKACFVYVCMKDAVAADRLDLLVHLGFRSMDSQSAHITTSEAATTYTIYRRFFGAGSRVELGEAWDRVAMEGEADKGVLSKGIYEVAYVVLAQEADTHEAMEEPDIQGLHVERDMQDRLRCSRKYGLVPDFGPHDSIHVDAPRTLESWTASFLANSRVMAIQTAQADRRAGAGFSLRFTVFKPSHVYLGYDCRAKGLPLWIEAMGFRDVAELLRGTDGFTGYRVFRMTVPAGTTVTLGGNAAAGARGVKNMYMVLVTTVPNLEPSVPILDLLVPGSGAETVPPHHMGLGTPLSSPLLESPRRESSPGWSLLDGNGALGQNTTADFWDRRNNGPLILAPPLFDLGGRDWSMAFNVDAVDTKGW